MNSRRRIALPNANFGLQCRQSNQEIAIREMGFNAQFAAGEPERTCPFGSKTAQKTMTALSPHYPELQRSTASIGMSLAPWLDGVISTCALAGEYASFQSQRVG
jgi:hypothetical protein